MKVAVATLGCKVNQYESAGIMDALREGDFSLVPFTDPADCYIINTCTVTGKTDYQSRQLIRRATRNNPDAAVIVTGCYAQTAPEDVARIPGVTIVAGTHEKENIPDLLRQMVDGIPPAPPLAPPRVLVGDIFRIREMSPLEAKTFPGRTRGFLKIQDGCNAFCSYCIVPYARGKSRSLPEEEIMRRVDAFTAAGYREVVVTGIHLGAYGQDLTPPSSLLRILENVEKNERVERLRLSSLEPAEIAADLIALMQGAKHLCRHFHIPLQSGDSRILTLMKRDYDAGFFKNLVEKIVHAIPDVAIGIDVMVGFPGEGEKEFSNTARLIEELPIAYLHVFPYSERPGTPAANLPGKVGEREKKKRGEMLRDLGKKKRALFAERFKGKKLTVLIEGRKDRKTGCLQGFSGNYIPVVATNAAVEQVNRIASVVPEEYRDGKLFGRIVHD